MWIVQIDKKFGSFHLEWGDSQIYLNHSFEKTRGTLFYYLCAQYPQYLKPKQESGLRTRARGQSIWNTGMRKIAGVIFIIAVMKPVAYS
jgi:hypothetical protein